MQASKFSEEIVIELKSLNVVSVAKAFNYDAPHHKTVSSYHFFDKKGLEVAHIVTAFPATLHKLERINKIDTNLQKLIYPTMQVKVSDNANCFGNSKAEQALHTFLVANRGKWLEVETEHLFDNQYNVEGFRLYDTHITEIEGDLRKESTFKTWGGVKPTNFFEQLEGYKNEVQFKNNYCLRGFRDSYLRMNSGYNSKPTLDFIVDDIGVLWECNGMGYKKLSKKSLSKYITKTAIKDFCDYLKI